MGDLFNARRLSGVAVRNNQLVVVGGKDNGYLDPTKVHDSEQNSLSSATPTLSTGRWYFGVVSAGEEGMTVGRGFRIYDSYHPYYSYFSTSNHPIKMVWDELGGLHLESVN